MRSKTRTLIFFLILLHFHTYAKDSDIIKITLDCDTGKLNACVEGFFYYMKIPLRDTPIGSNKRKEFLKRIASFEPITSLKEKCINEKKGKICFIVGEIYSRGYGVDEDHNIAVAFYTNACDMGYAEGCYEAGRIHLWKREDRVGLDFYKKACDLGYGEGCLVLAELLFYIYYEEDYKKGEEGKNMLKKGIALLKKACDLGSGQACERLAYQYETGNIVIKNPEIAIALEEKACLLGWVFSCGSAGMKYEKGDGVKMDYEKAIILYQKGCEWEDHSSCLFLGIMYDEGRGVKKNQDRALVFYKKTCEIESTHHNFGGCYLLRTRCEEGDPIACLYYMEVESNKKDDLEP